MMGEIKSDMNVCCSQGGCQGGAIQQAPTTILSKLAPGQVALICETCLDPADAAMLRAMGMRPNSLLRLCRAGEPCIVEVLGSGEFIDGEPLCDRPGCGCRIGLARAIAERVKVMLQVAPVKSS